MDMTAIKDSVVSGLSTAGGAIKNAVIWCGHKISIGWTDYVLPSLKTAWEGIKVASIKVANFMRTGHGLGLAIGALGIVLYSSAFHSKMQTPGNQGMRIALMVSGGAAIIAGIATAIFVGPAAYI